MLDRASNHDGRCGAPVCRQAGLIHNAQCTVNAADNDLLKHLIRLCPYSTSYRSGLPGLYLLCLYEKLFYSKHLFSFENVISRSADFMSKNAQSFCLAVFSGKLFLVFFNIRNASEH